MRRDHNSMSFGDHLDELRRRLIFALLAPIPILIVCLVFGADLLEFVVHPLEEQLRASGQPVRLLATSPVESFGAYLKVGMGATLLLSAPWILYQAWLFIAPGLYQHERKFVYFLMPASALLTTIAMVFLYKFMLPVMLRFFIVFGSMVVQTDVASQPLPDGLVLPSVPVLRADPPAPEPGTMWVNESLRELRIAVAPGEGATEVFRLPMDVGGTIAQEYRVGEYINLVFNMAIVFAVSFQLPIVMMLLAWVGILEAEDLKPWRRHALFVCAIIGAVFTPADPGSMIMLMVPLYLLFELGLFLMDHATPPRAKAVTDGKEGE